MECQKVEFITVYGTVFSTLPPLGGTTPHPSSEGQGWLFPSMEGRTFFAAKWRGGFEQLVTGYGIQAYSKEKPILIQGQFIPRKSLLKSQ